MNKDRFVKHWSPIGSEKEMYADLLSVCATDNAEIQGALKLAVSKSPSPQPKEGEKEAALREFANWMDDLPYFMAHGQCKVNGTGMLQQYKSSLEKEGKKP